MDTVVRLSVMLAVGLIARHAAMAIGRRLASGSQLRIPTLCSYATAGCTAAVAKFGLSEWGALSEAFIWVGFGGVWGLVAGLMLPFGRRIGPAESVAGR